MLPYVMQRNHRGYCSPVFPLRIKLFHMPESQGLQTQYAVLPVYVLLLQSAALPSEELRHLIQLHLFHCSMGGYLSILLPSLHGPAGLLLRYLSEYDINPPHGSFLPGRQLSVSHQSTFSPPYRTQFRGIPLTDIS